MFTAKDVMALREMSGAGMMDCKKALTECNGDMDKAMDYLREKSLAASAKKAARIAAEGIVASYVSKDAKLGVIVEVNCETDFVAKTDDFKALVANVAKIVAEKNPADVDALMAADCGDGTVAEMITRAVAKIGEKITIRRFARVEAENGCVDTYIHLGGKIGVLVEVAGAVAGHEAAIHDVAMHIAAAKPNCLSKEDCNQEDIEHEKKILREQAMNDPEARKHHREDGGRPDRKVLQRSLPVRAALRKGSGSDHPLHAQSQRRSYGRAFLPLRDGRGPAEASR